MSNHIPLPLIERTATWSTSSFSSAFTTISRVIPLLLIPLVFLAACGSAPTAPTTTAELSTNPPTPSASPSSLPSTPTPYQYPIQSLQQVDPVVLAFPGPTYYEGDLLSIQINTGAPVGFGDEIEVTLQLDDQAPYAASGNWEGLYLYIQFDTTGLSGSHTLHIRAEKDGVTVDKTFAFTLLPATQRPAQEADPQWAIRELDCCVLHYITGTAAERDIAQIAQTVQEAADEFNAFSPRPISEKFNIFLIDRMWYNGAFGWPEGLVIAYTDRYYGPGQGELGLKTIVRHEIGHAVYPFFSYGEGFSVYLAGGHYKPEPIAQRAAAMLSLGYDNPDRGGPIPQHEIQYLHQAALVDYIVETYGWDTLLEFIDLIVPLGTAETALQNTAYLQAFGITQEQLNQDFYTWLETIDPGEQVTDLELSVQLQELRRTYQETYTPKPEILLSLNEETAKKPEFVHIAIREAHTPAHIATELLIANAQKALLAGNYDATRNFIEALKSILTSGKLEHPLAQEYANIALTLFSAGYETLTLDLNGSLANVQASKSPPEIESLSLYKENGRWIIGTPPEGWEPQATPTPSPTVIAVEPTEPSTATLPTQMPLPDNTLYFDDFSDPTSGWDQYADIKTEIGYTENNYRVWIDSAKAQYWFDSGRTFSDVSLETVMTVTDGPDVNSAGLVCRLDPETGDMIQFVLDGQGRYGIIAWQEFTATFLGAEGMQFNEAIHPSGEPNKIQAICTGDTVTLIVNDVELLSTQTPIGSSETRAGVFVKLTDSGIEAIYDYFLVTEP